MDATMCVASVISLEMARMLSRATLARSTARYVRASRRLDLEAPKEVPSGAFGAARSRVTTYADRALTALRTRSAR